MPTPGTRRQAPLLALSPQEAAEALGISRQGIYNLMNRGQLPSVKLGRSRRIPIDAVEALMAGKGADAAA